MIEFKTIQNGPLINKNVPHYVADTVTKQNAVAKDNICKIKGIGSQITLIASVVEQLGDAAAIDTAEFAELKALLTAIREELA